MGRKLRKHWVNITIWAVVVGFALGGIIFFTPGGLQIFSSNQNTEEEPALIVGGRKVSPAELELAYQNLLQQYRQLYQQINSDFDEQLKGASGAYYQIQLRSQAADSLSRQTLLDQEAKKRGISVPRTQVDVQFRDQYDQFLLNNNVTEDELVKLLRDPNIRDRFRQVFNLKRGTLAEFKAKLRADIEGQLRREKLRDEIVGQIEPTDLDLLDYLEKNKARYLSRIVPPILPTDDELKVYFDERRDQYAVDSARVRHILIRVPPNAPEEEVQSASRKIEELRTQLEAGADFEELAKQYSQDVRSRDLGGDLGWIQKGAGPYGSAFDDAVFSLEINEISEPVRTAEGFHIVQVLDRQSTAFDDVKERVKSDYVGAEQERLFEEWLKGAREQGVFPQLEEVKARHILLRLSQDAPEDEVQSAYRKAEEIRTQLEAGADFEELAKAYSDDPGSKNRGGDLGWFGHGRMVPEFDKAAFALQKGEISEPVRSQFGFHIIQVVDRRATDALKNEIKEAYIKEEGNKRFEDWVNKLVDGAKVEVKDLLLVAYRTEEKARETEDLDEKLRLFDEAIADYDEARDAFSNDPFIGYYKSRLYKEKLDLLKEKLNELGEDADEQERQALQSQIEEARLLAVRSFLEVTSYGERDQFLFDQMLELAPENADLHYQYARFLLEKMGDEPGALDQLGQTVAADSGYAQAYILMADVEIGRGEYGSAIENLKQALEAIPTDKKRERHQAQLRLARAYLEQAAVVDPEQNLKQAETTLQELLGDLSETDRLRADVLTLLGDLYERRGEYKKAQDAYQSALAITPRTAVEVKLGQAYLADGDLERAKDTFESVANRDVYSTEARKGLGDVYRALGDAEKALENYKLALDLRSDVETKRQIAKAILELDPGDIDTRFKLAQLYLDDRIYSSAMDQYEEILQLDPKAWQAQRGLGDAYLGRSEYAKAKDHFKSALLLEPPVSQQIVLYEKILDAERELAGGPDQPLGDDGQEAMLKLAELYWKQGLTAKAREELQALQQDYPEYQPDRVQELLDQIGGRAAPSASEGEGSAPPSEDQP
jgi:peptidyl-prolyl cis-trans isomerase SurA